MKTAVRLSLLLAAAFAAFPLQGADVPTFLNFQGDYLKHGTVKISDGETAPVGGKVKMHFIIASTGQRARLKISGTIRLKGAVRPFSTAYVFKPKNVVVISDLAPALDEGHVGEGAYTLFPRKITADIPFTFVTTTGKGSLLLRLKKRPQGTQLIVVQTLVTSALTRPITWTFKALSRP